MKKKMTIAIIAVLVAVTAWDLVHGKIGFNISHDHNTAVTNLPTGQDGFYINGKKVF